jgi:hypothetical protein
MTFPRAKFGRINYRKIVKWVPVESRALAAVGYDHDWHQLYLEFRSGDIYCYRGSRRRLHAELEEAWIIQAPGKRLANT